MDIDNLASNMIGSSKTWQTIDDISKQTGEEANKLQEKLNNSALFVKSNNGGTEMYTTRQEFKQNEGFLTKIIGAFRNRID